jgi:NADH-quinone oxidoreductase subunit I
MATATDHDTHSDHDHGHDHGDGGHKGERKLGLFQRLYIGEVLRGMGHTIRKVFMKPFTVDYVGPSTPKSGRLKTVNGYRGEHYLKRHENGAEKCVACYMCSTACPAQCIEIDAEEAPVDQFGAERFKRPTVFNIDMLKCIYCGYCVEACPKDAIGMTTVYNQIGTSRSDFLFTKERLLKNNDDYMDKNGLSPSGRDAQGNYPFSPDGCGPDITHGMDAWRTAKRLHEMSEAVFARRRSA